MEVFYDGKWGTICSHQWSKADADVFCRQLGFKEAVQPYKDATHGEGSGPIWLDHLVCSGNEKYLHECTHDKWGKHDCTHKHDASVRCTHGSNIVRLAGGSHNSGRVEVFVGGQWGIICDHAWDILDANVVCHQLGFIKGARHAQRGEQYGRSSGPFHRDHIYCEGSEKDVLDCPYGTYHHCYHFEYASVVCHT